MKPILLAALALALFTFPASALMAEPAPSVAPAQSWTVDPAASTIEFSGQHAGNDFKGTFKTWTANIQFDPANLLGSLATVKIDTASASTGNSTYDGSLPSSEWLNPKAFPEAVFQTKSIRQIDVGSYEADATLTIKGVSKDVVLPFTVQIDGDAATMKGSLALDRLGFEIGKAADPKAEWVTKDIAVTITVKATKAP